MPVLGTKVRLSAPRRKLVPRPRLTDRLTSDPVTWPRLVLVSAPAGFGKTTLLTQWLGSRQVLDHAAVTRGQEARRVAWLSLDTGDSGQRPFLAHLIAALQTAIPEAGEDASALMDTDRGFATEEVLVSLVNDLEVLAGPLVVALDDYHVVD